MRNFLLTVLIFIACFFMPLTSHANETTHREAVETLLLLLDMKAAIKQGMEQMLAIQMQQNPQFGLYQDVQRKFFEKYMSWENLKDEFIAVFMEEFSENEIRELIEFYRSPTGQKTIKKMPVLMSKGARIQAQRLRENMAELEQLLQDESDRLKKLRGEEEAPPQ